MCLGLKSIGQSFGFHFFLAQPVGSRVQGGAELLLSFSCFFSICFLSALGVTPHDAPWLFLALHLEITLHVAHHMGWWGINPAQMPTRKMLLVLFLLLQVQSFKR